MRGKRAPKRKVEPDKIYGTPLVTKFINYVMLSGKKRIAERIVYGAIESAASTVKKTPLEMLEGALNNVRPSLEIRSRRVGGANYQIPVPVSENRQVSLGLRWIISAARKREGSDFQTFLSDELVNAFKNEGEAVKTKVDTEKMAEANKAFAHFRW